MDRHDVFSVFGGFGPGGMTTAILNRSRMLAAAGHACRIVTLDYGTGETAQLGNQSVRGRLASSAKVLNPFAEARSECTTTDAPDSASLKLDLMEPGFYVQADEFESKHYARYFHADGNYAKYKKWSPDHSRLVTIDYFNQDKAIYRREEFDDTGNLHREIGYINGNKNRERYLTTDGFCYLVRWFEPETGKGLSLYRFTPGNPLVTRYPSLTAWRNEWLQRHVDDCATTPVVIADGRYVMPQLLKLRPGSARLYPVMHSNHYTEAPFAPGSPIKDYYSDYFGQIGKLDGIITLTTRQAQDVDTETEHTGKVLSIPNSIAAHDRTEISVAPGRVGMFGRIIRSKGHLDAIHAWPQILQSHPAAELHIFGSAPTPGDPYLKEVKDMIKGLGLSQSVKLRGYTTDVAAETAKCALTLLPSTTEGMPFAVVESMLAETPVIAYDCNYGPRDLIDHGHDGYVIPVGDTTSLATKTSELLNAPALATQMGAKGRDRLANTYSEEATLARWNKLLN